MLLKVIVWSMNRLWKVLPCLVGDEEDLSTELRLWIAMRSHRWVMY